MIGKSKLNMFSYSSGKRPFHACTLLVLSCIFSVNSVRAQAPTGQQIASTLNTVPGEVFLKDSVYPYTVYKTCRFNSFVLSGELKPQTGADTYPRNTMSGEGAGECAVNPDQGWTPVRIGIQADSTADEPQKNNASMLCEADPLSDTYTLKGVLTIRSDMQYAAFGRIPITLKVRTDVLYGSSLNINLSVIGDTVGNLFQTTSGQSIISTSIASGSQYQDYSVVGAATEAALRSFGSQFFVGRSTVQPSALDFRGTKINSDGNSLYGTGCFKPTVKRLEFSGSLNSSDRNYDELVDTGVLGVQALDISDVEQEEDVVDEQMALDTIATLSSVLTTEVIPTVTPENIAATAYNIKAAYKDAGGTTRYVSVPAVINVPTPVIVPALGADVFLVTLSAGNVGKGESPEQNAESLTLRIQRSSSVIDQTVGTATAASQVLTGSVSQPYTPCLALPVDISVSYPVSAAGVTLPGATNFNSSVGYRALSAGARTSPKDFKLSLLREKGGYTLHQESTPCGAPDRLDVIGFYKNPESNSEVQVTFGAIASLKNMDLKIDRDKDTGKQVVTYRASGPLVAINVDSKTASMKSFLGLYNVPENIDICSSPTNGCNLSWRASKKSMLSISFASYDLNGQARPLRLALSTTPVEDGVEKTSTHLDMSVSNFNADAKFNIGGSAIYQFAKPVVGVLTGGLGFLFGGKGDFPYWIFLDTRGNGFTGSFTSIKGSKVTIVRSSGLTSSWDHQLKLKKKWYGTKWVRHGSVACNGFGASFNNAPGALEQYIARQFCK